MLEQAAPRTWRQLRVKMLASHQEDEGWYLGPSILSHLAFPQSTHCHACAGCQVKYPHLIAAVFAIQRCSQRVNNPSNALLLDTQLGRRH